MGFYWVTVGRWTLFLSRREHFCYKGWYGEKQGIKQKTESDVKAQKKLWSVNKR